MKFKITSRIDHISVTFESECISSVLHLIDAYEENVERKRKLDRELNQNLTKKEETK